MELSLEAVRHHSRAQDITDHGGEPPLKLQPVAALAAVAKVLIDRRQRGLVQGFVQVPVDLPAGLAAVRGLRRLI